MKNRDVDSRIFCVSVRKMIEQGAQTEYFVAAWLGVTFKGGRMTWLQKILLHRRDREKRVDRRKSFW